MYHCSGEDCIMRSRSPDFIGAVASRSIEMAGHVTRMRRYVYWRFF